MIDSWPAGTRVIVRSPESWADGLTGTVQPYGGAQAELTFVKLDDGTPLSVLADELRTYGEAA